MRKREAEHVPEGHGDLEPGRVTGSLRVGREGMRGVRPQGRVHAGALLRGWAGVYQGGSASARAPRPARQANEPEGQARRARSRITGIGAMVGLAQ
jgi:hypothetical protein